MPCICVGYHWWKVWAAIPTRKSGHRHHDLCFERPTSREVSVVHIYIYLYKPFMLIYIHIPKPFYIVLLAVAKINMFQFFFFSFSNLHTYCYFCWIVSWCPKKRVGVATKFYCGNCKGINITSSFADPSTCYNSFKVWMFSVTVCMYGDKSW